MANDERIEGQEPDLEQYIEEGGPSKLQEFLSDQVKRAPWWAISFLFHATVLLILSTMSWGAGRREEASLFNVPVNIVDPVKQEEIKEEPDPPEQEQVKEDFDVPIEDIPISPETPSKNDPGPDLDMEPVADSVKDVERPVQSIDPPSNTPVFAVESPNMKGLNRGIYSGRNSSGRGRSVGGGGGTTKHAESTVMAGLIWLAKAQEPDGSWSCKKWEGGGDYDVGMTGFALLAFLGAGYTHAKPNRFQTTVAKGLAWLHQDQKANGSFGWKTFYEMGIAGMAVSEAYGLTQDPKVGRMAQKALDFIVATQPDHGGFRYGGSVPKDEGDMSVTGWQIMALKSGICAELKVPEEAINRSRVFLKNTLRDYGSSSYIVSSKSGAPAVSAIGMLCRQFLGGDGYDAEIRACADYLLKKEQGGGQGGGFAPNHNTLVGDPYYTYYSVLAMFQIGGEYWLEWNKRFRDPLVKLQIQQQFDGQGRFVRGSWDPKNFCWGQQGGRVFSTAMNLLSLEVYYRFLPVYRMTK
jgi:hypothetical protein